VRFTIERIRTLVLVAGALLLVTLGVFLVRAKFKNLLNRHDLPQKLAKGIVFESDGFTVVHALGAHSQYRIHASREVELKTNFVELHDVQIDLYGEDGKQIDKISGDIFEYDLKTGKATAQGPVEMLLTRPSASTEAAVEQAGKTKGDKKKEDKIKAHVIADVGATDSAGQIDVKTSGVTFDRNSGLVTTDQRVNFSAAQGNGSAMGASYNSQSGYLTLEQAVELTTQRDGNEFKIHAQHAEFDRGAQTCEMEKASAAFHGGQADAAEAKIMFREDGSAERLDAKGGFTLATTKGRHVAAPVAWMEFDEHSEPLHGHMEGGVTMDSVNDSAIGERKVHGTAPTAELNFAAKGELKSAHLERGVEMTSEETSAESAGQDGGQDAGKGGLPINRTLHVNRKWRSPVVDIGFRAGQGRGKSAGQHASRGGTGEGQLEVETMRGSGGVTITSESQSGNAPATPSKMSADEVTGSFGAGSALRTLSGVGHAEIDETTATGGRQTANGDRLVASFAQPAAAPDRDQGSEIGDQKNNQTVNKPATEAAGEKNGAGGAGATEVQSAELDGNVVLFEQPAQKTGAQPQPPLRATAGKAVYEGQGEWLHLTMSPRVVNGGLELTADKVDVSQQSGDAFAHGDVKATWTGSAVGGTKSTARNAGGNDGAGSGAAPGGGVTLGGKGPAHVVAAEAQLNQSSGEATFHGHARLWQQTNFVSGPVIVLNQHLQTLVARSSDPAEPVRVVMLSAGETDTRKGSGGTGSNGNGATQSAGQAGVSNAGGQPATPSVIRVRGGELKYSDAERRAVMHGGTLGAVVAETGTATSSSDAVELLLMPAGNHDASGAPALNGQAQTGQAQVDQMKATGHVVLTSQGRRGTGEQLVYTGANSEYVLTGSAAAPPKMSDPERGTVTGEALIFDSRDDRVRIEGGGRETETDTTAPDAHGK
jgi:lipopolysaccharide export system protein LptA